MTKTLTTGAGEVQRTRRGRSPRMGASDVGDVVLLTAPLFAGRFGRMLGSLGILFGIVLFILGFFGTFSPLQQAIDNVLIAPLRTTPQPPQPSHQQSCPASVLLTE